MSKLLVYLAGSHREQNRIGRWAAALERDDRIALASHWFEEANPANFIEACTIGQRRALAAQREGAIRASAIAWVLWPDAWPDAASISAHVELGYALGQRFHRPRDFDLVVSGLHAHQVVYTASADYFSDSDALAFDRVLHFVSTQREGRA